MVKKEFYVCCRDCEECPNYENCRDEDIVDIETEEKCIEI